MMNDKKQGPLMLKKTGVFTQFVVIYTNCHSQKLAR